MSAQRKDQLHEEFMAVAILAIMREAILAPQLAELAGPISQRGSNSLVSKIGESAAVGIVETGASEPTPAELVIRGSVEPKGALLSRKLLPLAPYEFAASDERMVNGSAQWLPAQGCVNSVELRNKVTEGDAVQQSRVVVATGIREPEIKVRRFRNIPITSQMCDGAYVAARASADSQGPADG